MGRAKRPKRFSVRGRSLGGLSAGEATDENESVKAIGRHRLRLSVEAFPVAEQPAVSVT